MGFQWYSNTLRGMNESYLFTLWCSVFVFVYVLYICLFFICCFIYFFFCFHFVAIYCPFLYNIFLFWCASYFKALIFYHWKPILNFILICWTLIRTPIWCVNFIQWKHHSNFFFAQNITSNNRLKVFWLLIY